MERGGLPLVKGILAYRVSFFSFACFKPQELSSLPPIHSTCFFFFLALATRLVARQRRSARSGTTPTCLSFRPPSL